MKKIIIGILLICGTANTYAQKYITRTGKISFHSSTPLENIDAITNEAASALDSKTGDFVFQVAIKSFKFERALMQEHFNENYMQSDKIPKADYKGKVTDIASVNFAKDGTYKVNTSGKLTIHGVTKDVSIPATITIKGNNATINAKFKAVPQDYKINIPSIVEGKIAKQIDVTVNSILEKK